MTERRSSGAIATQTPDCTFVCCIEAGPLETMTLRLVESLRRFGGRAAQSPVIAVRPRRGPSLSRSGRRRLDELGVEVLGPPKRPRYDWYHFLNKPKALVAAEAIAQSDVIAFLDGDTLVLAEPQALWLGDDSDFAAKPEIGSIESNGPGSTYEPLWEAFASALGLSLDDLPWVLAPEANRRTRYYVNSGVFSYRRCTELAQHYLCNAETLLDAGVACSRSGIHWIEQAALGLTVIRRGLSRRNLGGGYNFSLHGWGKEFGRSEETEDIRILHYHNSMQPETRSAFLGWLQPRFPEAHTWLQSRPPSCDVSPTHQRMLATGLRAWRGAQRRRFLAGCRVI